MFDKTAQEYQNLTKKISDNIGLGDQNGIKNESLVKGEIKDLLIKQDQMTWLVYIIGGVIGGRMPYNVGNSEENDMFDGELGILNENNKTKCLIFK